MIFGINTTSDISKLSNNITRGIYAKYHSKSCYYLYKSPLHEHILIVTFVVGFQVSSYIFSPYSFGPENNKSALCRSACPALSFVLLQFVYVLVCKGHDDKTSRVGKVPAAIQSHTCGVFRISNP